MNLADLRRSYERAGLRRADLEPEPRAQFEKWFAEAQTAGIVEPNAMTLATVAPDGAPSARIVLLNGLDERGFHFFTNYDSRKGRELAANARAALVFLWKELERQVRIEGGVGKLGQEESFAYFRTRPRESRVAAWASAQSAVLRDRAELEAKFAEMAGRFPGDDVPLPPNWGGYALRPHRLEFWQGRSGRLHDRFLYTREPNRWRLERLSP